MSAKTLTDWQIVMRSLRARPLSTWITIGMVATSVALLLVLFGMRTAARGAFDRGSGNIHLLVSADPSPLVAVLNGIFYANAPSKPIAWSKYQSIRSAFPYQWAIPTQQGDSYRGSPTMATSTDFFSKFEPVAGEPWKLASGKFFERPFEIVLGSAAAKASGLRLGQEVFLTHGSGASREGSEPDEHAGHVHTEYPFKVVGVLEPTGSAHDRALFIDLESSWILHAFDRRERAGISGATTAADLEDDDRKITGILLRLPTRAGSDASAAMQQQFDTLRRDTAIVVAQPAQQIQKLFEIVSNVDGIFIGMAVVVLISSSLSTMLALYNSMAARTRQIAVLRVLGASQGRVFGLVLTESLVITMAGALSGIVLALLGGIAASAWLKASIGLVIDPTLDPRSTVIVLGGAVALGGIAGICPRGVRTKCPWQTTFDLQHEELAMNGTKIIWIAGAALAGFAVVLALTGNDSSTVQSAGSGPAVAASTDASSPVSNATSTPATPTVSTTTSAAKPATPATSVETKVAAEKPPVVRAADAVDLGLDQKIHDAKVVPGNIVPKKDAKTGEMLLYADGKYEIRGLGTPESPYRVSWECLASASESYMPRLHENEIPQRIALLHGKVLEIDGYQAFPLMVSETKELIVMLNQWDGCCIGVPPTPYDAVEVKLLEPAKRGGRHAAFNFGGVRGTFRVDPYLVENWLVGLYILDGARMVEGAKPEL